MRRSLALLACLATAWIAASPANGHAPRAGTSCANTYGGDVIFAEGVGCKRARDVVRTWAVRTRRTGEPDRQVGRFRCRMSVDSVEGPTMRCRRPGASIRWYVNLPS